MHLTTEVKRKRCV